MKKTILLLFIFTTCFDFTVDAQDILHVDTYNSIYSGDYCLKIYVHNIAKSDQSGGISDAILNTQVASLNNYFSGTGITFNWDGNINDVYNDTIYNTEFIYSSSCDPPSFSSLNSNSNSDGIDLFFIGRSDASSIADGIANRTRLIIGPNDLNTSTLAHELGHILGLFHTYHGTITQNACENNDNLFGFHIPECANGSFLERRTSGDFVADTEAYSGYNIGSSNCNPQAGEDGSFDTCGDEWNAPDADNFMGGFENCENTFSPLQIKRMKYFLGNSSLNLELHDAIISNCSVSQDCQCGKETKKAATEILFGQSPDLPWGPGQNYLTYSSDMTSATFNETPNLSDTDCEFHYEVSGSDGEFQELTIGTTINFSDPNNDTLVYLKVITADGTSCCYSRNFVSTQVATGCPSDPVGDCENCSVIANQIASTIESVITPLSGCRVWRITTPDFGDCIESVTVNWGDGITTALNSNDFLTHIYESESTFNVIVNVTMTDGSSCQISKTINTDCSNDCPDCEEIVSSILDSLTEGFTSCTWLIRIPDLGDCGFQTKLDWGDGFAEEMISDSLMSHTYNESGTYTITVTLQQTNDQLACSSSKEVNALCSGNSCNACPVNPSFTHESAAFPNCGTTFYGNSGTDCPDDQYTFQWKINNEVVGFGSTFEYTGSNSGWVNVQLKVISSSSGNFCTDSESRKVYLFSPCLRTINMYPNPSKPSTELQFDGINAKDVKSIELFDLFGNSKMKVKPSQNSFKVPELQPGLYIVKFYTSKGIEQKKLIIE